jgi:hypothetical protein
MDFWRKILQKRKQVETYWRLGGDAAVTGWRQGGD